MIQTTMKMIRMMFVLTMVITRRTRDRLRRNDSNSHNNVINNVHISNNNIMQPQSALVVPFLGRLEPLSLPPA